MTIESDLDYRQELCKQADFWGMESLTEIEQCIVNQEKYDKEKDFTKEKNS